MYVHKAASHADRPKPPGTTVFVKQRGGHAEIEERAAREKAAKERAIAQFAIDEEHEVGLFTKNVKPAMEAYLETTDGKEEVRRAVARFIRERDGETRAEIDALRVANDAMRAEVDAIEMLQTDLMDARRETSEARANVKVMNMEDKERARLEAEARNASRCEAAAPGASGCPPRRLDAEASML